MIVEENHFETIEAAAQTLAKELAVSIADAISTRGQAQIAVSGGRTPKYVFELLCYQELDWDRVTVTLTDERWVHFDHVLSNEKLVRDYLLREEAAAAHFVALYGGEESPDAGQNACEKRLQTIFLPFDAVYIGLGNDGHFASLFPCDPALEVTDRRCVAVSQHQRDMPRISLTAATILAARKIYLLFSGLDKYDVYLSAKKEGPFRDIPLRLILLQRQVPVYVLIAP